MGQTKIPESLYGYFERTGHRKLYRPGEAIYLQGDASGSFYFIREGRVRAFCTAPSGKELTFEIIEKGRIFGESSLAAHCARPVSVMAVNEAELYALDSAALYQAMGESKELAAVIFGLLSDTCNHLTEQLKRISLYDSREKAASFLLTETENPDPDRGVTENSIPYTQEDLAMILGMNRVTVNRILTGWREEKAVSVSYGEIRILNRDYLKDLLLRAEIM